MDEKKDVYARITAHIVSAVERGAGEFRMPWHGAGGLLPVNVASEQAYRGVNVVSLWAAAEARGYAEPLWGTYRQFQALGAQVRKGETATPVVFWQAKEKESEAEHGEEEASRRRGVVARGYYLFNVAQVDGYKGEALPKLSEAERVKGAEAFLFGVGADVRHTGGAAYYHAGGDYVRMPPYESFKSAAGYYSTLAHELTHWSGAAHRLGRDLTGRFGTAGYAAEELVAELGAAFQMARLGLSAEPRPDHAAYVQDWLRLLRDDTRAVFTAAAKAEAACVYLAEQHERLRQAGHEPAPGAGPAFEVEALGSVWRFTPLSPEASRFAKHDLPLERWQWVDGGRFVLDQRVARDLVARLERDGWAVSGPAPEEVRVRRHER